jgi:WD40 repeat protein
VSGGREKRIRRWRVEDGKEVGKPMDAGSVVYNLAVSQDGQWIVCGTHTGQVSVWDAKNHEKVIQFKAHSWAVNALDVSADGTRIATGSRDWTLCVWSFPAGERLLGPLEHFNDVLAVKFSPDGRRIATGTWRRESIRIYDSSDGDLLADFSIRVNFGHNESLAWASDSNRLFALCEDGNTHCLDVSTKKTLAKWGIHSDDDASCIAVACNDTIIVACANSSLSLWDTKTHQQIGTVIHHSRDIWCMAISPSYVIATAEDENITLRNLCAILPSPYRNNVSNATRTRPRPYQIVLWRSRCAWSEKSGA